jgi:hypothetical protein
MKRAPDRALCVHRAGKAQRATGRFRVPEDWPVL